MRIVIGHRNHLSVMSNNIAGFTVSQAYDFTTALTQAARYYPYDSSPMVSKNGVWCMWPGDLDGNGVINTSDVTLLNVDFNKGSTLRGTYAISDLNMDGAVNSADVVNIDDSSKQIARSPVSYFDFSGE